MIAAKYYSKEWNNDSFCKLPERRFVVSYINYIDNCRSYQENPDEAIKQCQVLLEEQNLDMAVRVGDVFGLMIEHYARRERWKAVSLTHYLIYLGVYYTISYMWKVWGWGVCNVL